LRTSHSRRRHGSRPARPSSYTVLIGSAGQESDSAVCSPAWAVVKMFPPGPDDLHEPA
jgi:hypothetical protein